MLIWTPDKDLAQCVRGDRVLQVDRRANKIRTAEDIRACLAFAADRERKLATLPLYETAV